MNEPSGYELSRKWFDFCFDNPEKIKPVHTALFLFAVEHNNRLGWREKFGFPSEMAMSAIGIRNWRTYTKALNDLENWGFIFFVERSRNQYSSNIISLFAFVKNTIATTKALDKAMQKHLQKHSQKQSRSIASIDKHKNIEHRNIEQALFAWNNIKPIKGKNKLKNVHIMKKCTKVTDDIILEFRKLLKKYKPEEIVSSFAVYRNEICRRDPETGYADHRFSLLKFLRQKNGCREFITEITPEQIENIKTKFFSENE